MPRWYQIPRRVLDDIEIVFEETRYRASVERDRVVVRASGRPAAGTRVSETEIRIWGGTAIESYVRGEGVRSEDLNHLLAAGLIVSSLIGNPRQPRAREAPRFMWSDHVALARGDDPERALRYSSVSDPIAAHAINARGRITVFVRGRQAWPSLDETHREATSPSLGPQHPLEARNELVETPYEDLSERPEGIRRDPFPFDPDARDRATLEHRKVQNWLADVGRSKGYLVSRPEPFDILWRDGEELTLAEVKTINAQNEAKQLRLGLGQVLDYQDMLARSGHEARAVIVTNREPTDLRWVELCARHGVSLVWAGQLDALLGDASEADEDP